MKKDKRNSLHISRRMRAILNLVGIAVIALALYISIGCPAFSVEDRFRREEIAHSVGPAKILDKITLENYTVYESYNNVILAASDEGVTLYLYHDDSKLKYGNLVYREKQGDITVLAVPSLTDYYVDGNEIVTDLQIPVIVFDSFPEAVRAEMEIELSVKYIEETVFQKKYTSSADREAEGYFLFDLIAYNFRPQRYEYEAFYNLASFSDDISGRTYYTGNPIPVTVRFYDQNGALICTQSVEICSPVAEAHAKRGE